MIIVKRRCDECNAVLRFVGRTINGVLTACTKCGKQVYFVNGRNYTLDKPTKEDKK